MIFNSNRGQPCFASTNILNADLFVDDDIELSTGSTEISMRLSTANQKDSCSSTESLENRNGTPVNSRRRSFRESLWSRFQSIRKRGTPSSKCNICGDRIGLSHNTTVDYSQLYLDSVTSPNVWPETHDPNQSVCSSASSVRSHRFKFWSNSTDAYNNVECEESKAASSRSAVSDTILYQRPTRHRVRFWLNEKSQRYSDSILEIRQSEITARIIRSRCLADIAAVEAARAADDRRKVRALKFASAATAAAVVRLKKAIKDPNASHGSIANAAMYVARTVAAASLVHIEANEDYKRFRSIFKQHFKHKDEPTYFRRLKYIPMQQLDKSSAAYKMHMRLKAIPAPSCKDDIYKFYSSRIDRIAATQNNAPGSRKIVV